MEHGWIIFPFSWECHHPNWRSPSFFRGVGWPPPTSSTARPKWPWTEFKRLDISRPFHWGPGQLGHLAFQWPMYCIRCGGGTIWDGKQKSRKNNHVYPVDSLLCTSSKLNNSKLTGAKRREWGNDPLANYQYLSIIIPFPPFPSIPYV